MARPRHAAAALAISLLAPTLAAQDFVPRPVGPLRGSLVLAGEGKLHDAAVDVFVHLAGGYDADLVVASSGKPRSLARWSKSRARTATAVGDAPAGDGRVDWLLPKETALVVGYGRKVGAVGEADVHVRIPGTDVWPERRATISPQDVFELTDFVPYDLDLVAWLRSARDRQGPAFPPESPDKPVVPKGTLVLSGDGGVQSETWKRFIDAAGGKQATYVCFPSGSDFFIGEEPKSCGAGQLRDHGCYDVQVVDPASAARADEDPELLALLEQATGVWIDGGRTYRVMDALQYTRAHELIREVLEGGGAVGGSSAG